MRIFSLTAIVIFTSASAVQEYAWSKTTTNPLSLASGDVVSHVGERQEASGGVVSKPDNLISGAVKKSNGKPAAGATVTLSDAVTGEERSTKTDKRGRYAFAKVFQGEYSLSATAKQKNSLTENLSVGHNEKLRKDLQIQK